ncbi:hypothetical protein AMK27_38015 [Streptomyces sp. CB02009]|uniref:hypothetical protein n=1 Tax=Streptomyces sp. CB02009 TaxID=1703938 RepID=UPI00093A20FF|nr:hypothetical protein [Streptomyces sp. CB02009]OKJ48586.1 hypothetical protein AMK27_38015 [Streptomyces sp. CB02009]
MENEVLRAFKIALNPATAQGEVLARPAGAISGAFIPAQPENVSRACRDVVERYRLEIDRLQRKVTAESARRRGVERRFQEAVARLRHSKNPEQYVETLASGGLAEDLELPLVPDVAELLRRLEESEADRAALRALLDERGAAFGCIGP